MKKFDKNNFKKLALLGIAGGTAIVSPGAVEATDLNPSELLAFGGCKSSQGCGGLQAYRSVPSQGSYYYSNQPQGSCGGTAYYPQQQQQTYYQPQSGCGGTAYYPQQQQAYYPQQQQTYYQPQGSCGGFQYQQQSNYSGYTQGQYPTQPQQPSSGCASNSAPQDTPSTTPSTTPENESPVVTRWETSGLSADASKGTVERTLSESDLLSQLNEQGKASYQRLDAAGKALALKLANQTCKGLNECKGLNSCKNSEHSCAGKGACAGTSDSNFKDKNLAVKVAAMKMAEKRTNATPQRQQ